MRFSVRALLLVATVFSMPVVAEESDPWEGFNRSVFAFNDFLDRNFLLPVTRGYQTITPDPVETGVHNVLSNLDDVVSLVSNLAQFKGHESAQDFARVVANTTFGLFGILDVATSFGLPKQGEDPGQALGYWGVESGPYLVLPLFGPSTVRDGLARIPESAVHPASSLEDGALWGYRMLNAVDSRAQALKAERLVSGDRYSFIRDAWLQRRAFQVNDGQVEDAFIDDGF